MIVSNPYVESCLCLVSPLHWSDQSDGGNDDGKDSLVLLNPLLTASSRHVHIFYAKLKSETRRTNIFFKICSLFHIPQSAK